MIASEAALVRDVLDGKKEPRPILADALEEAGVDGSDLRMTPTVLAMGIAVLDDGQLYIFSREVPEDVKPQHIYGHLMAESSLLDPFEQILLLANGKKSCPDVIKHYNLWKDYEDDCPYCNQANCDTISGNACDEALLAGGFNENDS
jgi:hypothetical protein